MVTSREGEPMELTLRGTVAYAGDLAVGPTFRLTPLEESGSVAVGRPVLVTVLVSDARWADVFHAHPPPAVVDVDFTLRGSGEPYATASFSGFVDDTMTSWDLRDVRAVDG
jgi:hypothetical protein